MSLNELADLPFDPTAITDGVEQVQEPVLCGSGKFRDCVVERAGQFHVIINPAVVDR